MGIGDGDDDLQIADCTDSGKLQKMLGGEMDEMDAQMLINNRTVTG